MFRKVLVANRGEIAVRVVRACRELGATTVVAYSEADRESLAVAMADESICIGPGPVDKSYLNIPSVVTAALITGCDALHPGYGFLAENADAAEVCDHYGVTFIGSPPSVIREFGDKIEARRLMKEASVRVLPGTDVPLLSLEAAREAAREIGYPVMIKAAAGGGGRGMRAAKDETELTRNFPLAQAEALSSFGNRALYLEALLANPRHVEIQLLADNYGNVVHLGERDCSIQRRHQKILEEAPSPAVTPELRSLMGRAAVTGARAAGFRNVGTAEFLLDQEGLFYFIEMNTRIQVEHGVTELVTGEDLVKWQLRLAAGGPLTLRQEDVVLRGHAIECRLYAEDPEHDFAPRHGTVSEYFAPSGPGIRVDSHVYPRYSVPPFYDCLLAKIMAWGVNRAEATARMERALAECRVTGVLTNLAYHKRILSSSVFREGEATTSFLAQVLPGQSPDDDAAVLAAAR